MSNRTVFAAALFAGTLALPAWAALPTGTLEFVQRTGTVAADATIPVVMRLTIDPGSAPLTFTSNPLAGFDELDLPTEGRFQVPGQPDEVRPFVSVFAAYLNTYYTCHGDFTIGCGDPGGNYQFEFNTTDTPAHPSINFRDSFTLAAGESYVYTFGFFVPKAGGAAPGAYRWNGTAVTLNFRGLDVDGNEGIAFEAMEIATGSDIITPGVGFERSVTAIPEPGTYALMAAGLVVVGGLARRRRTAGGTVTAPASP